MQYDALIDHRFLEIIKAEDPEIVEVGAWFETPKQLVEAAGLKWRGREGFTWDWYNEVGFLIGYTPDERKLLIDTYFEKFKEIDVKFYIPEIAVELKDGKTIFSFECKITPTGSMKAVDLLNALNEAYALELPVEMADIERHTLYKVTKKGRKVPMLNKDAVKLQ